MPRPRCRFWDVKDYEPWIKKLNYAFEYDETSESFLSWKNPQAKRCKAGDLAGYLQPNGYWRVKFESKLYLVHHIVWIMHGNTIPEPFTVDHDDRKSKNNNITNLRLLDNNGQAINRNAYGESQYKGVSWNTTNKKWNSAITINGKPKTIGAFKTQLEAAAAWDAEAIKIGRTDLNLQ